MRSSLLLLALMVCSLPCQAERVWVLGSFSHKDNALEMMERISLELGVEVLVVPYVGGGTYRVVIRETQIDIDSLAEKHLQAWRANIDLPAMQASSPLAAEPGPHGPEREPPPVVIVMDSGKAIGADETIEAYCERVPADCDRGALARLQQRRHFLDAKRRQLDSDCGKVTMAEEREICDGWRTGRPVP